MDPALAKDWMQRWKQNILATAARTAIATRKWASRSAGVVSPFLNGFYYGYMATGDREWVDRLIDWTDSVVKRGVKEPDGYIGWPKEDGAGDRSVEQPRYTDIEVGDAMFLRPMVLMAGEILKTPALKEKYGAKAEEYLKLSEQMFEKWDSRGAWRETKEGGLWVVPPFGFDPKTGKWTDGYEQRKNGRQLPAGQQGELHRPVDARHVRRDAQTRSTGSGPRSGST